MTKTKRNKISIVIFNQLCTVYGELQVPPEWHTSFDLVPRNSAAAKLKIFIDLS